MNNNYSISVISLVYNEEEIVQNALMRLSRFLQEWFLKWEIVVVESGSTDKSAEIVDALARDSGNIRVLHQKKREGFGSALRLAYAQSRMDLIWLVPPDICFPLETVIEAIPLLSEYDCVLSYRSEDNRKIVRRIYSLVYNFLVKTIFGLKQKHVNSAFKLFKSNVIKNIELFSNGWFIDAEILLELKRRNINCIEIPVKLIDRTGGKSTIKLTTVFGVLQEFLSCVMRQNKLS